MLSKYFFNQISFLCTILIFSDAACFTCGLRKFLEEGPDTAEPLLKKMGGKLVLVIIHDICLHIKSVRLKYRSVKMIL